MRIQDEKRPGGSRGEFDTLEIPPAQPMDNTSLARIHGPRERRMLDALVGGPAWRRQRGLMTISDAVMRYRALRVPRGNYRTPLPQDFIEVRT